MEQRSLLFQSASTYSRCFYRRKGRHAEDCIVGLGIIANQVGLQQWVHRQLIFQKRRSTRCKLRYCCSEERSVIHWREEEIMDTLSYSFKGTQRLEWAIYLVIKWEHCPTEIEKNCQYFSLRNQTMGFDEMQPIVLSFGELDYKFNQDYNCRSNGSQMFSTKKGQFELLKDEDQLNAKSFTTETIDSLEQVRQVQENKRLVPDKIPYDQYKQRKITKMMKCLKNKSNPFISILLFGVRIAMDAQWHIFHQLMLFGIIYYNMINNQPEKRVLPARSTRGKRPQISEQQTLKEDALYNQIFEAAQNSVGGSSREGDRPSKRTDDGEYKHYFVGNKINFPYSRGYHYFFDLSTFPRVEDTVSYAIDENNAFHSTFRSEDRIVRGDLTVGKLFNRRIIGLPIAEGVHMVRTKDKNICHRYLFQNEDRKFEIDRNLYELKQILKQFDRLQRLQMMKSFISLKRDVDLLVVLEDEVSVNEKKMVICRKIKELEERKQNMRNFFAMQDKNFFYHSLNQKLHNSIEELSFSIRNQFILAEIPFAQHKRSQLEMSLQEGLNESSLSKLFLYSQTEHLCLRPQTLDAISQKIDIGFFRKSPHEDIYSISVPFMFLTFDNHHIMTISEKLMALKLAHQNQASFYICKLLWKRVFERDLTVIKEVKPMSRFDYDKLMAQTVDQLHKWKKAKDREGGPRKDPFGYPKLDDFINWNVFVPDSHVTDLFSREREVEISAREYICLVLFYRLYFCISDIYEFLLSNQNLIVLIVYDFYFKAHNYIVEGIGTPRFGILYEVLHKLTEFITASQVDVNYKLKWVYSPKCKAAYIVKSGVQSEWETEKKEENQKERKNDGEDFVEKKVKTN